MLIHEDSDFARIWKELGTERIFDIMSPIKKESLHRFFVPAYQRDLDEYGFPKHPHGEWFMPKNKVGTETFLSGKEYHDMMLNTHIYPKQITDKSYEGNRKMAIQLDEIGQWEQPKINRLLIKPVGMPVQCFSLSKELTDITAITKLLHTDKTFDGDFKLFTEWLKKRLLFKRMDRYDLKRNRFMDAGRRYGITFAGQSFTTY